MSELQIGLLVIGIAVVIAVYGYGAWQQWQYRRKYGAAFDAAKPEDVLQPLLMPQNDVVLPAAESKPAAPAAVSDEACALVDDRFDFVVHMALQAALPSAALEPFLKRRFDFGKTVTACGLNAASGSWERLIPDSPPLYNEFKLALQLADRSGAVSELRLNECQAALRDIASKLLAEIDMPGTEEALARAQRLDEFCAKVDQLVGFNLLPGVDRKFFGSEIARIAGARGFSLQADGAFHLLDQGGGTLCKLCDMENQPFQHHTLNQMRVSGLTLLLDVPRATQPVAQFDAMVSLARALGEDFRAALVDDHRVALGEGALAQIRARVSSIEGQMLAGGVVPGSAQALRLFA